MDKSELLQDDDKDHIANIMLSMWNMALTAADAKLDEEARQRLFNSGVLSATQAIVLIVEAARTRALAKEDL